MGYRIVELESEAADPASAVEVRSFDSAYRAMEVLREAVLRCPDKAQRWYVVDPAGRILLRPCDVGGVAGGADQRSGAAALRDELVRG